VSIRALQWGHGLGAVDTVPISKNIVAACRRFNGATAWEPWIPARWGPQILSSVRLQWGHGLGAVDTPGPYAFVVSCTALQWGHGLGAVDTTYRLARPQAGGPASMGPRLGSRGYFRTTTPLFVITSGFNGATAWEPWIRCGPRTLGPWHSRFNGATAWEPWIPSKGAHR